MKLQKLLGMTLVSGLLFAAGNAHAQRAVDQIDAQSDKQGYTVAEQLEFMFPQGAASKELSMPLGSDGTIVTRDFPINTEDRGQTYKEVQEWINKVETLSPVFETEDPFALRDPSGSCNGANNGSVATESTSYSNPNTGLCHTVTTTYVCTQTAEGSAGVSLFGGLISFGGSAPVYGWTSSGSSSTAPQLCP